LNLLYRLVIGWLGARRLLIGGSYKAQHMNKNYVDWAVIDS